MIKVWRAWLGNSQTNQWADIEHAWSKNEGWFANFNVSTSELFRSSKTQFDES